MSRLQRIFLRHSVAAISKVCWRCVPKILSGSFRARTGRWPARTAGTRDWGPDMGAAWHGLAIEHVVTRSVRDSAAVLDAIAGNMPGDPYSAPPQRRPFIQEIGASPGRLRIGLMKRSPKGGAPLHPDCV